MKNNPATAKPEARRRLLQLLAVSGVFAGARMLPESWIKPVVDEATLPAHAQMSPVDDNQGPDTSIDLTTEDASTVLGP